VPLARFGPKKGAAQTTPTTCKSRIYFHFGVMFGYLYTGRYGDALVWNE